MAAVFGFTGIPGTGVQTALGRLEAELGGRASIFCLDKYLWEAFARCARSDAALLSATDLSPEDIEEGERPNWWLLLVLPPRRIRQLWCDAASAVRAEIAELPQDHVALVSFHAGYYSDHYRWRFSAADPRVLQELNFQAFFCLIDDIYDIQARRLDDLANERGSLADIADPILRFESLVRSTVERLDLLIAWRQEEIVLSDLFAAACGVPSHVVAVKHPVATLRRMLEHPHRSWYLSHPITGVRTVPGFVAHDEYREIVTFVRRVREIDVVVEPTTIDEFRFTRLGDRPGVPTPWLSDRWPHPEGNILVSPTTPGAPEMICAAANVDYLDLRPLVTQLAQATRSELPAGVLDVMRRLENRVGEDITWRDHHLVDQTGRLVVYRPVPGGTASTGVWREVEYLAKLSMTGALQGRCLVFHPEADRRAHCHSLATYLLDGLITRTDLSRVFTPKLDTVRGSAIEGLTAALWSCHQEQSDIAATARRLVDVLANVSRVEPTAAAVRPMTQGGTSAFLGRQRAAIKAIEGFLTDLLPKGPGGLYLDALGRRLPSTVLSFVANDEALFEKLRGEVSLALEPVGATEIGGVK